MTQINFFILSVNDAKKAETIDKTKRKIMSAQVNIELGELTNSDQPSETTRFNPDDTERYGNSISSLSLLTEQIVMLKGFVMIQLNFAEMQCFTIGGATSVQTAETNFTSYISV